jgi:hypothetical protein
MDDHTPDRWLIVKITNTTDNTSHYRLFASWYGGYLGADAWRLNSGITKVTENVDYFFFEGTSGSVYVCHKGSYGLSGYGSDTLNNLIKKSKEHNIVIEPLDGTVDPMTLDVDNSCY